MASRGRSERFDGSECLLDEKQPVPDEARENIHIRLQSTEPTD